MSHLHATCSILASRILTPSLNAISRVHSDTLEPLSLVVLILNLNFVEILSFLSSDFEEAVDWDVVRESHLELGIVFKEFTALQFVPPDDSVSPGGSSLLLGSIVDEGSFIELVSWREVNFTLRKFAHNLIFLLHLSSNFQGGSISVLGESLHQDK